VCFYRPEEDDAASKMILTMKHAKNSDLFDFAAIELYPKIKKTLDKMQVSGKNCIFTWTPRKRSSVSKYGFDQGAEVARRVAKLFGATSYPLFLRFGGKEQKKLSAKDRKSNVKNAILLNHSLLNFPINCKGTDLREFTSGKNIVIIDDVLTSGATLERAVTLLESMDTAQIIVACIAKTARRMKKE
jgi:predicted amidophosphoribosyltransferase